MSRSARSPQRLAVAISAVVIGAIAIGILASVRDGPTASKGSSAIVPTTAEPICPGRFAVDPDDPRTSVPVCTTTSLDDGDPAATRLVIIIHGDRRNGPGYFDDAARAARAARASGSGGVLVIAPQVATRGDLRRAGITEDLLTWSSEGWKIGDGSREQAETDRISSFEVVDRLIAEVVDGGRFPAVRHVVIAGHSAGGQFVNRYAAATRIDARLATPGVDFGFVVANPSSYLYFDGRRVREDGSVDIPSKADRADCPGYDRYKYGLDDRNAYLSTSSRHELRDRYGSRSIAYVAGALDVDPEDASLDRSCAARLQGETRLERAMAYQTYLRAAYDPGTLAHHVLTVVPGVGHDSSAILDDPLVRPLLFGSGDD